MKDSSLRRPETVSKSVKNRLITNISVKYHILFLTRELKCGPYASQVTRPGHTMKSSLAIFYANVATAVGALVLACAPASAASYAAGTLSEGVPYTFESGVDGIGTGSPLPGVTFSDNVTFTLATTQGLTSQIDYSNFADEAVISGLAVKLFRSGSAAPLFQGIDGTPGDLVTNRFVAASLSPGDYILVVSGAGSGLSGGWYTGAIGAVPPGGA